LKKEENGKGRGEKPLEVQSCKQKLVKDSSHKRNFCKFHAKQEAVVP
jgi:hypothetical protein